ncbi:hypothetical protein Bca52824_007886 [Brassica carinata]|uniref:ADP-ribosyl cyclase/cyclic ADP-ribose hydrolase n=1 Tax=Brassica carinata TaxID=52824 RepID=A0A8X7W712_BRACI|nr:hypothetical protein Bca52824_007886 [Brassica carinata]
MVSSADIKRYHVFPSFHGPDVRKGLLSHLQNLFERKGITTFKDQEIKRGYTIGPELVQAIRESRISIVVLSKKYASSSWCLDELVEILKCREHHGQMVMLIFYQVDPSDVRKQKGEFGNTFEKTCEGRTEEERQRWIKALAFVATIAGEHSLNWDGEADMIEKFATDVSNKLNVTLSKDFDDMVGLQVHLRKVNSLLRLESDEVKMIGIWGPAGIGKSTIARALYNQLYSSFKLICFMGNLKGYKGIGLDAYDSKLWLQNQLLSKILNQMDMKVHHLGAIKEWLKDQRVLIILDDVDDLEHLEVLAKEPSWFGYGSRIIVTTKDRKILKAHGIEDIYHVDFPSKEEALEILCISAFRQSSVPDGFKELANKVAEFCGDLPLGLSVVGSSLRGESKEEWELQLSRIETNLDRKIEDVLKVGYDRLSMKDQSLFLHIACVFNCRRVDYVTTMLADSNLDVGNTLKTLVVKSLVYVTTDGWIVMHYLLRQLGRQVVALQSGEPGKRQFLVEAEEIRDVLANNTGTGSVIGITFDMSNIGELSISKRAFEGMRNLKFLKFCNGNISMLEDMEYLPHLRLLHWDSYPRRSLPATFQPERLVELHMSSSNLEKLWDGIQPLANLRDINLGHSSNLKEIPNLWKATNLETLTLTYCTSLVEVPSSISNLHKLVQLDASWCSKLQFLPTNINLASLTKVDMKHCSRLRSFPDISSNIETLHVGNTEIEDVPPAVVGRWSRCSWLEIDLSNSDIKRIPDSVISLPCLQTLIVENCTKLESIPSFSSSLMDLNANNCVSLKRVCFALNNPFFNLLFGNCLKLDEEARRRILQQDVNWYGCLPGKEIPAEFPHRATGNSITIPYSYSASSRYRACFLLSTIEDYYEKSISHVRSEGRVQVNIGYHFVRLSSDLSPKTRSEHLFLFGGGLFDEDYISIDADETKGEIVFEFSCQLLGALKDCKECQIMGCGVQILNGEAESSGYSETGGNSSHRRDHEAVHKGRRIWSREEDKTSIILGVVVVFCTFLIIQIFREIGISDP